MLYQKPIPSEYTSATPGELTQRVEQAKTELGSDVVILTHHYQRPEIVKLGHIRGDSLKLAQWAAAQNQSRYVVFCGVHFMAESADILKSSDQQVILPDLGAGCDMADMAEAVDVEASWEQLVETLGHEQVIPITYINSTAALKAFVGKKGGVVCTSTNAKKILTWALNQSKKVFFFPDQHLGRNTAKAMGIDLADVKLWKPSRMLGGLSASEISNAKVLLWEGHCPVHALFTVKQIEKLRKSESDFKIISHPECAMEVVDLSDYVGSTEYIVKTIENSPAGTKWAVGTEIHLIERIAQENPTKTVVSLNPYQCLCGTMNRIDLPHLAWSLDNLVKGKPENVITVSDDLKPYAKQTLDLMLELSK